MAEKLTGEAGAAALAGQLLNRARAASIIAHDLSSPLGSILLYADLLLAGELEPQARERVERIRAAAVRSQSLTVLLSSVSMPAGGLRESVPIGGVIVTARALLDSRLRAAGAQVQVQAGPGLPPIPADRNTLVMLLTTLLDLALGSGSDPQTGEVLRVTAEAAGGGGNGVLQVRLTGPGVRPQPPAGASANYEALRYLGAQAAAEGLGGRLSTATGPAGGAPALLLELPTENSQKAEHSGPISSNIQ